MSFWERVIWSDETRINLFCSDGCNYVWRRPGEPLKNECTIKTIKHGGGGIIVWACMNASGVGKIAEINGIMDGLKYVVVLQKNLIPSRKKFGLENQCIFQQDNDP
jgi:hypothetical protein